MKRVSRIRQKYNELAEIYFEQYISLLGDSTIQTSIRANEVILFRKHE